MSFAKKQDLAAQAAADCAEVKALVAEALCTLEKASITLEFACRKMDWDDEPNFDIRDAMRCAGLALAKLLEWEKADAEENGGEA